MMPQKAKQHRPRVSTAKQHRPREQVEASRSKRKIYSHAWTKASKGFLAKHRYCVQCQAEGKPLHRSLARVTDHIIPHKGNMKLFWDRDNWQPLCFHHHNRKTAREDGGFGNRNGNDGHTG